jgi:tetratricopeptide (TPR) repeat protein
LRVPPAAALPRAIARLVDRQGITLSDTDWARSIQILFEKLRDIVRSSGTTEPLGDLHSTLLGIQSQYFAAMADPRRAVEIARQALQLLDQQMPSYPQDQNLQIFRGYFLKNEAMSLRDLGDGAGFNRLLAEADRVFQTMRAEAELYLSNAYNGLGSVTLLQAAAQRSKRQGKQALQWIDKALALVPDHPHALHDRQETLRFLGGRPRA